MTDRRDPVDVPRTAEEVAMRALALSSVIACAKGASREQHSDWLKSEGLWSELSPSEKNFLSAPATREETINMTWRLECLAVLLWAIQKLDSLPSLAEQCETKPMVRAMVFPPQPTLPFMALLTYAWVGKWS